MKLSTVLTFILALLLPLLSKADEVEMADLLVANGKIYVVVAVLGVILVGVFIFLLAIDFRLRKLEKNSGK